MKFIYVAFFLLFCGNVFSQGSVHPIVQREINNLNLWIEEQLFEKNEIDAEELKIRNQRIKEIQDSIRLAEENKPENDLFPDKIIVKEAMPGSSFTVPEDARWTVKAAYLRGSMHGYSIEINLDNFKNVYDSGERLVLPSWTAEFHFFEEEIESLRIKVEIIEF